MPPRESPASCPRPARPALPAESGCPSLAGWSWLEATGHSSSSRGGGGGRVSHREWTSGSRPGPVGRRGSAGAQPIGGCHPACRSGPAPAAGHGQPGFPVPSSQFPGPFAAQRTPDPAPSQILWSVLPEGGCGRRSTGLLEKRAPSQSQLLSQGPLAVPLAAQGQGWPRRR